MARFNYWPCCNFRNDLLKLLRILVHLKQGSGSACYLKLFSYHITCATFLLGGAIPDATAIHAARKKREALRAGGQFPDNKSKSYISLKDHADGEKKVHSPTQDDDDSDVDEARINFTGVRSAAAVKHRQLEELDNSPSVRLTTGE